MDLTTLGTGTLNASGVATLTLTTLPVGTDSLTAAYAGDTNFLASNSSVLSFTVGQASLTITASSGSFNYGGTVPTITPGYSGFVGTDSASSLTTAPTCSTPATSSSPVSGSPYVSSCSGAVDSNYTIHYTNGSVTEGTANLYITASSGSFNYGGTVPTITPGYSGFVGTDSASSLTTAPTCSTTATSSSPVSGSPYVSSCSGAVDSNYTIHYTNGSVTEGTASLTITASSGSFNYGGTVPTITPGYSGFVGTDSASSLTTAPTCSTTATSGSPVGGSPYVSSCSGAVDSNYTIHYTNGSVTEGTANLYITASSGSFTYGGTVPTITPGYSGFVGTDSASSLTTAPTCSTPATSGSAVGGSPYVSSCSGAVDSNYTIHYTNGSVTEGTASLTITASSGSFTYGGTVPTITPGYSGFVGTDSASSLTTAPTCSTTATSSSPVSGSPYVSSCSGAVDSNYTIHYTNGSVTEGTANLYITASSGSFNYGGTVPTITPGYSGFVGTDSASSLTTAPTCSTTATSGSPVGGSPYVSSCSGAVDSNYTIHYTNGSVTEGTASLTITASSGSFNYGGSVPTITPGYSGFEGTDSASSLTAAPTCSTTATSGSPVSGSPYVSSCSGAVDSNYTIHYTNGSVVMNAATPAITWATPGAVTYGTTLSATQLNASSTVSGTFAYAPAAGAVIAAGSHTLSVTFSPTDSTDYTSATTNVTLMVDKATLSLSWSTPDSISYGTPLSATQLDATAGVLGTFNYSPGSGAILDAGSQTLSVTFAPVDSSDYNPASTTVTLVVNTLTLTASLIGNPTKPYDGTTTATLTPANYSLTGFAGSDGATVTETLGEYASPLPGSETVTAALSAANFTPTGSTNLANYILPTSVSGPGAISIGQGQAFSLLGQAINPYAGESGTSGYSGDGGPAAGATLNGPASVAVDQAGNLYIADGANNVVRKVTPAGYISTYAGTGTAGYSGDGSAGTSAELSAPWGVALDASGNLYIADSGNNRVRKVTPGGTISTYAGTGAPGFSGDGNAAISAKLSAPSGVAVDSNSNLYVADAGNNRIRIVSPGGNITTYAGSGTPGFSGDGSAATSAQLSLPAGLAVDSSGNLFIADTNNNRIRMVDSGGTIFTVAGNGNSTDSGDGLAATSAGIKAPQNVVVDSAGNLYVAESARLRWVSTRGIIQTLAGNGTVGSTGDGGAATSAELGLLSGVGLDALGQLYLSDSTYNVVRRITQNTSFPATAVGQSTSAQTVAIVVNAPAAIQSISVPSGFADFSLGTVSGCAVDGTTINPAGTVCSLSVTFTPQYPGLRNAPLTLTDGSGLNHTFALRGVGVGPIFGFIPGVISTFAGSWTAGTSGDGGQASAAQLNLPHSASVGADGSVYIADFSNDTIRRVNPLGIIKTIVGIPGTAGYSGDGGPATSAELSNPAGVAADAAGNLYVADFGNHVIRKIDSNGTISTVAGNGSAGSGCPSGGLAVAVALNSPTSVAFDSKGNLYLADAQLQCVVVVYPSGSIARFAGTGSGGFSGDSGPAASAQLNSPASVAVDANDNVYIADQANARIREVNTQGVISTVAGNGTAGYSGDGGPATSAELNSPGGVALDPANNFYITDNGNQVVRLVNGAGTITTVAGMGIPGSWGDGDSALLASLYLQAANSAEYNSYGVGIGNGGILYIADTINNVIRLVNPAETAILSYPNTAINTTSSVESAAVLNLGNAALNFSAITTSTAFALEGGTCLDSVPLNAGNACIVGVVYRAHFR